MRIIYIVLGCIYMGIQTLFISKINRYEAILTRQHHLLQFIGTKPIKKLDTEEELDEYYKTRLERVSNIFFYTKVSLLAIFFTACGIMFWLQYGGTVYNSDKS